MYSPRLSRSSNTNVTVETSSMAKSNPAPKWSTQKATVRRARVHIRFTGTQWDNAIISDEKKFNLDVAYSLKYYWYDLPKQ